MAADPSRSTAAASSMGSPPPPSAASVAAPPSDDPAAAKMRHCAFRMGSSSDLGSRQRTQPPLSPRSDPRRILYFLLRRWRRKAPAIKPMERPTRLLSSPNLKEQVAEAFRPLQGFVRARGPRRRISRWAKCPESTPPELLARLLTRSWGVRPPGALISVVGDECPGGLAAIDDGALAAIRAGLQLAATKTHAWVLTGGACEGASLVVSRALQATDVPCVGFLKWSEVGGKKGLLVPSELSRKSMRQRRSSRHAAAEGSNSAIEPPDETSAAPLPSQPGLPEVRKVQLEPNHSHLILSESAEAADDAQPQETLRDRLENFVQSSDLAEEHRQGTPIVCVLINGVDSSLLAVQSALARRQPVVVLANTGGAADDLFELHCALPSPSSLKHSSRHHWDCASSLTVSSRKTKETPPTPREFPRRGPSDISVKRPSDFGVKRPSDFGARRPSDIGARRPSDIGARYLAGKTMSMLAPTPDDTLPQFPLRCVEGASPEKEEEVMNCMLSILTEGEQLLNDSPLLTFCQCSSGGFDTVLHKALLSSCHTAHDQIMLAVSWGEASSLETLLEKQQLRLEESNPDANTVLERYAKALETALVRNARAHLEARKIRREGASVVEVLLNYNHDPRYVNLNHLYVEDVNCFRVYEKYWRPQMFPHQENARASSANKFHDAEYSNEEIQSSKDPSLSRNSAACRDDNLHGRRCDPIVQLQKLTEGVRDVGTRLAEGMIEKIEDAAATVNEVTKMMHHSRIKKESREGHGWALMLSALIPGYKSHLAVRKSLSPIVQPTWTELMFWAVMVDDAPLARVFWARTHEPIRAALLAAQLYHSLANLPQLRSDEAKMLELAIEFERLSIGVLDTIADSFEAVPLITVCPTVLSDPRFKHLVAANSGSPLCLQLLWNSSCLDLAVEAGQARHSAATTCRRFVAQRHSRYLLDSYFCGDFPGSKARIPMNTSLIFVIMQVFFWFLPGIFCEVMPSRFGDNDQDRILSARAGEAKDKAEDWKQNPKDAANTSYSSQPDGHESDVFDDYDGMSDTSREGGIEDFVSDLVSNRVLYFFFIPKIKFIMHMGFHILYITCLEAFLMNDRTEHSGQLNPEINVAEVIFWIWTLARFVAELNEFESFDLDGLRAYIASNWNKLDLVQSWIVLAACVMRLYCSGQHVKEVDRCDTLVVWVRCGYALATISVWVRSLQYVIELSEKVGVLVIIFTEMLYEDVRAFSFFVLVLSTGFGFSMTILLPNLPSIYESEYTYPFFLPLWSLVGSQPDMPQIALYENLLGYEKPTMEIFCLLLFSYLLATLVLVNLLIAAMTSTYERVKEDSRLYWQFERTKVIMEFKDTKGALPPPFNLLPLVFFDFPRWLYRNIRWLLGKKVHPDSMMGARSQFGFKAIPTASQLQVIRSSEIRARKKFLQQHDAAKEDQITSRIDATFNELEKFKRETRASLEAVLDRQAATESTGSAALANMMTLLEQLASQRDNL